MKSIECATIEGFEAKVVDVEVDFIRALPSFSIVGLANTSIQESKERVKAALNSIDFKFPPQKITVNLSPSDLKKEGSHFDLPIAMLIALQKDEVSFEGYMVFGELGLDGAIKDTSTLFAIILSLANLGIKRKFIVPKNSIEKLSKIPAIELIGVEYLKDAIKIFKDSTNIEVINSDAKIDAKEFDGSYYLQNYDEDFFEIKGQERAKRASLISVAGMHNILFEGSPGCGKSMCAKRLRHIMPPMSLDEILYRAKLDALSLKEPDFTPLRSFRSPHHTATRASIFGGGSRQAKIGEIALAHNGVLFFDEITHFPKSILEALREPLEDHKILISRVGNKVEYPTKFLFVAAMNPCPCGNLLSLTKECRCSEVEIKRYKNRLSSPLLDRIDLYVQMQEVSSQDEPTVTSKEIHELVLKAFKMQRSRAQSNFNGKLNDRELDKVCKMEFEAKEMLDSAVMRFSLSQRAINNIKRVARTIADLQGSEVVLKSHILEALSFRVQH